MNIRRRLAPVQQEGARGENERLEEAIAYYEGTLDDLEGTPQSSVEHQKNRHVGSLAQQITHIRTAIKALQSQQRLSQRYPVSAEDIPALEGNPVWVEILEPAVDDMRSDGWHLVVGPRNDGPFRMCLISRTHMQTIYADEIGESCMVYLSSPSDRNRW